MAATAKPYGRSHQFASQVKVNDGAAIASYENGQGDLPVSVLFAYVKLAGVQLEDLIDDDWDLFLNRRIPILL